jgi:hypothetical protein
MITITVEDIPVLTVSAEDDTICDGGNIILTAGGADSYTWSPTTGLNNSTGAMVTANPTETTTYMVTGNSNGCTNIDSITVYVQALPDLTLSAGNSIICPGDSTLIQVSGADSYNWNPAGGLGNISGGSAWVSPTVTTSYVVEGITNGCSSMDSIIITVNANPVLTLSGNSTICAGDSLWITASGADSIIWDQAGNSIVSGDSLLVFPNTTTNYTVTGITNGCESSGAVTVYVTTMENISVQLGNNPICPGDSVLMVCSGSNTYTISPMLGVNMISTDSVWLSPTTTTAYTISGAGGLCSVSASALVEVLPLPQLEIYSNINTVYLLNPETVNFGANGDSIIDYSWSFGDGNESTSKAPSHDYTAEGVYTVVLEALNEDNCTVMDSLTIQVIDNLGMEENELDWVDIYPNPNTGLIQLHIQKNAQQVQGVRLLDTAGRIVYRHQGGFDEVLVIDIQDKADGNYILEIRTEAGMYTRLLNKRSK